MAAYVLRLSGLSPTALASADRRDRRDRRERFFHVHKLARDAYGFAGTFFSIRGDVLFANHYQSYLFLEALQKRSTDEAVRNLRASELHAMGILHEIFHAVIGLYRAEVQPGVLSGALDVLREDESGLEETLRKFVERFPPPSVYAGEETVDEFLAGSSEGVQNDQWILEELVLLWIGNENPGYAPIRELVTDAELRRDTKYVDLIESLRTYFDTQPRFGPDKQNLIEMLLAPIRHSPGSVSGQLAYLRQRWGVEFAKLPFWSRLLGGLDFVGEEGKWFMRKGHGVGSDDSLSPPVFQGELYEYEPEQFSQDLEWMPNVVMLAKSTFVWLDQLSKRYRRAIRSLDEIPEEELDLLARRGFTALWLIGLWRRSAASQRIKQIQGNRDAVASAYSLHDYEIAPELGGDDAYRILRDRAARRGIRLASDMVPNHMGIDSAWVINHPDWFVQSEHPPFPNYRFDGVDVSSDPRVGIFIEDGYWNRSDAAVVFKRLDRWTGSERYIYHGNDGTSMPWNDTAQLDYLKAEVREAVIQTILHVARKFPIIRFDAAMTLAKRHYQRLWFPLPGTGGAIPSRAQFAVSKEDFDRLFPVEFWREVVDRVAAEVPNTLLLAEAFWLMEGYFVRTLGMHRVYNSAFMNMMRKEENANFRLSIRNVLEFNPQILKRHVNFMNNPDEETAIAQFGKDDKYFGVCTVMSTMPGLPMIGHGQVEGFTEKYGMEYKRAMHDEQPDDQLVARHEREIFPLLRRRYLFSEVENFLMYDFVTPGGWVDEDVFAFSNRAGEERAIVLYHNKFKETRGTMRNSVGFLDASGSLTHRTLADGLALTREQDCYSIFRDHQSGLEIIRSNVELAERGFEVELQAFKYRVLLDFRQVRDSVDTPYGKLAEMLRGRGVPSIAEALVDLRYRPIHEPLYEAVNPLSLAFLGGSDGSEAIRSEQFAEKAKHILDGAVYFTGVKIEPWASLSDDLLARYLPGVQALADEPPVLGGKLSIAHLFLPWLYCRLLGAIHSKVDRDASAAYVVGAWHLDRVLLRAFGEIGGVEPEEAQRATDLVEILVRHEDTLRVLEESPFKHMARLIDDVEVTAFLGVHAYDGILWFNKEPFEDLAIAITALAPLAKATSGVNALLATGSDLDEIRGRIRGIEDRALSRVKQSRASSQSTTEPNAPEARTEASAAGFGVPQPGGFESAMNTIHACGERSEYQFVRLKRELLELAATER